jgi:FkbM family methyltransferase
MNKINLPIYQKILLAAYRTTARTGLFRTRGGLAFFHFFYDGYKLILEARSIDQLKGFAVPGTTIIDVGANTGFFAKRFSKWAGPTGQVIAIEPEEINFNRLKHNLTRRGVLPNVDLINAAVSEVDGLVGLVINPDHPGDHRLGEAGQQIKAISLDALMVSDLKYTVSLIKVDVQGAEFKVICGALKLLQIFKPVLFLEIDEQALQEMDASSEDVFQLLIDRDYGIHYIQGQKIVGPLSLEGAIERAKSLSYSDFLFIPSAG